MPVVSVFCFVIADNREEAVQRAGRKIGERCGNEFYNGYEVQKELVRKVSDLSSAYLTEEYARSRDLLQRYREAAEARRKAGDRLGKARAMRRAGDLFYENLCPDMPWFNIEGMDFSVPSEPWQWGAVMVDFHY
jgi:ribosomal protein S17E